MASAVLVSQNESSWAHMGKTPYSNPHLNSNPNSNPKKKQKQFHHAGANGVAGRYRNNNNVDSPAVTQTASDDAYSFNQTSTTRNAVNYGSYLTFNVASYNKSELVELRTRLAAELDQIRNLRNRIETGQFNIAENPRSQAKPKKSSGSKRLGAVVGSVPKKLYDGCDNNGPEPVNFEGLLKECGKIVSKLIKHKHGYVFKIPVDAVAFGLHDYHSIVKRPMDLGTVKSNLAKNLYRSPSEFAADIRLTFNNALLYNPKTDPVNGMAEQLLARFEELFKPIQEKMDGLINQRGRGEMDVHEFRANNELPFREVVELQGSSWNNHGNQIISSPIRGKKSKPRASPVPVAPVLKKAERMQTPMRAHSTASTPSNPPQPMNQQALMPEPLPPSPVRATSLPSKDQKVGRGGTFRQPKPRAKDPNKREMNMEEKQKLGLGLQSLPQEKMPQLVQIIRKRNEHLAQDGDEIELDIEALDTETLWELDRFVTNWKKMVSKTKRQALMMSNPPATDVAVPTTPIADADGGSMSEKNDDDSGKKLKDNDDEDVEIDDDMPAESFPPVEIEKDEGGGGGGGGVVGQEHEPNGRGNVSSSSSSSGSSSSDSSSSSGIDTESSCVSTLC
ncbi:hypothetical protein ACS0TY_002874 [Phlomoides rotata]